MGTRLLEKWKNARAFFRRNQRFLQKSKISPSLARTFIWGLVMDIVCASPVAHQSGSVLSPKEIVRERLRGRIRTLRGESAEYSIYGIWYTVDSFFNLPLEEGGPRRGGRSRGRKSGMYPGLRLYGFPPYLAILCLWFLSRQKSPAVCTARLFRIFIHDI